MHFAALTLLLSVIAVQCGGALRAILRLPMGFAVIIACIAFIIGYKTIAKHWGSQFNLRKLSGPEQLFCVGFAAIFTILFIHLNHYSLITYGNADSGLHIRRFNAFVLRHPGYYHGFNGLYSVLYAIKSVFHLGLYEGYVWTLYLAHALTQYVLVAGALSVGTGSKLSSANIARFGTIAFILSLLIIEPLYLQFIGQGAFPFIYSTLPVAISVISYAAWQSPVARLIALACTVGIIRFSYGLNLGELMITAAALTFLELDALRKPRLNFIKWAVLILGIVAGAGCYVKLWKVLRIGGAATEINLVIITLSLTLIAASFLTIVMKNHADWTKTPLNRFLLYVGVYASATVIAYITFKTLGLRDRYYLFKYPTYAIFLSVIGALGIVAHNLGSFGKLGRATHLSLVAGGLLLGYGLIPFLRQTYISNPAVLASVKEWKLIEEVLRVTQKRFGGYLTWNWPRYYVINGYFDPATPYLSNLAAGQTRLEPGSCVFWQGSPEDWRNIDRNSQVFGWGLKAKVVELASMRSSLAPNLDEATNKALEDIGLRVICKN